MFARIAGLILVLVGGFLLAQPVSDTATIEAASENGWLGMTLANHVNEIDGEPYEFVGVWSVDRHGPAYKAGVRPFNVLLGVNNKEISNTAQLPPLPPGQPAEFLFIELFDPEADSKIVTITPIEKSKALTRTPLLRLSTEQDRRSVTSLDASAEAKLFVTSSESSVAKVRSLTDGKRLRTLRGMIATGAPSSVYAAAISPDGKYTATHGHSGFYEEIHHRPFTELTLFDTQTGTIVRKTNLPGTLAGADIAFSPDGKLLAITAGGELQLEGEPRLHEMVPDFVTWDGVLIVRVDDLKEVKRFTYKKKAIAVDFSHDGRLVTASWDGRIRLYDRGLELVANVPTRQNRITNDVAFHPSGNQIAVAYPRDYTVSIISGTDLSELHDATRLPNDRERGTFEIVEWSADGHFLYAGGIHLDENEYFAIRRWTNLGLAEPVDLLTGIYPKSLSPWGDRGILSGNRAADLIAYDSAGTIVFDRRGSAIDFFSPSRETRNYVSDDGGTLLIELDSGSAENTSVLFSLFDREISENQAGSRNTKGSDQALRMRRPSLVGPGLEVTPSSNPNELLLNGSRLPVVGASGEVNNIDVLPDGSAFIFSTDIRGTCALYLAKQPGEMAWISALGHRCERVTASGDSKTIVVALDDGTIRWYRASDGAELLNLFINADYISLEGGQIRRNFGRWILWTPEGYYDASPGGEDLIGWHINQGIQREALFYGASRFRDLYYRPDIIQNTLKNLTIAEAPPAERIIALLPPVVRILKIDESVKGRASVRYEINSPSGKPITEFRALVDGRVYDLSKSRAETTTGVRDLEVILQPGDQQITLVAATEDGFGEEETRGLSRVFDPEKPVERNLFALVVGISDYQDGSLRDLSFADDDANDVSAALKAQSNGFYKNVEIRTLTDGQATKEAILDALAWLKSAPSDQDVSLLFLAGHGINQLQQGQQVGEVPTGGYFFLPSDVALASLETTAVSYGEMLEYIHHARGYKILALDTCHSGQVDSNGLVNRFASDENGVIVFASSTASQTSTERADWENGAFTEALLEGLDGRADDPRLPDQLIDHLEMGGWLNLRVKNLTNGNQTPIVGTSRAIPATTIAAVIGQ